MKSSETIEMNRKKPSSSKLFGQTMTETAGRRSERIKDGEGVLPSEATLAYLKRQLVRKYGIAYSDLDDVIDDAIVTSITLRASGHSVGEGLFVVIARREACDRLRRRGLEIRNSEPSASSLAPDLDRLQILWLRRLARRYFGRSGELERRRMDALVVQTTGGMPWAEACQVAGIPRGSQSRYRSALRRCFRDL